ncbi:MAG: hypothetical protein JO222_01265 [Frankiales bacterium]|nr:hypothetical protein [Frankiales bacterium]
MTASDDRDEPTRQRAGLTSGALAMLSREAGRAAMLAATAGLSAWEQTRGLRELALRRADEVLQIVAHTPLGRFLPHPLFDDGADAEAERIAQAAKKATLRAVSTVREHEDAGTPPARASKPSPEKSTAAKPTATKTSTPKAGAKPSRAGATAAKTTGSATPSRPAATSADAAPPAAAVEAGAPGANTEQVEQITAQLSIDEPSSRDDLPIPDFDNISLGSLRARLRSLTLEDLVTLREWEQAHAHRLPVVTLLDNRIAKVSAEQQTAAGNGTAYPSESTTSPTAGTTTPDRSS